MKLSKLTAKASAKDSHPVGALEIDLAQSIAENRWRLKRVRAMETGIFAAGRQGSLSFIPSGGSKKLLASGQERQFPALHSL
jgi:hypothetical protein